MCLQTKRDVKREKSVLSYFSILILGGDYTADTHLHARKLFTILKC